ncbi:ChbG/HpnK family deacetylase [Candidatus Microgenomates bacterium]|nr:ChbG/HpnK family deacetylase [Candidatus Microgenomates bacterium]
MKITFYNDDFGLTYGFTDAIKDCILKGITTSSCVRTNGTAYEYAKKINKGKIKKVVTGIHFNLTDGKALNPKLANKNGDFKYSFAKYFLFMNKNLKNEIEKEFEMQLSKAAKDGFKISHTNSQEHVHMIPQIFEIVAKICKKHNIKRIRLTNEPLYMFPILNINIIKFLLLNLFSIRDRKIIKKYNLTSPDYFYGILYTDNMNSYTVMEAVNDAKKRHANEIEILAHPAYFDKRDKEYTSTAIKDYVKSKKRRIETQTFLDKNKIIRKFIEDSI